VPANQRVLNTDFFQNLGQAAERIVHRLLPLAAIEAEGSSTLVEGGGIRVSA
jgi:hypothetical protein